MPNKTAWAVPDAAALPHNFRRIRLELARERGHPEGSRRHGYTFVAPLDAGDRIDAETWKHYREVCRVVRFRPGEEDEIGHLVRKPGGTWAFHYDVQGDDDDEAGYRFSDERFVIGEYVSVREDDGMHTFAVTSVEHL
jgi:hypothetical protein